MSDLIQLHKGNNRHFEERIPKFWGDCQPEDVDANPAFFDKVMDDICDRNVGNPISDIGVPFRLFLGNPLKHYVWAEFMAHGVEKTLRDNGIADYRLQWERISKWRDKPAKNNTAEQPVSMPPVTIAGPEISVDDPKAIVDSTLKADEALTANKAMRAAIGKRLADARAAKRAERGEAA